MKRIPVFAAISCLSLLAVCACGAAGRSAGSGRPDAARPAEGNKSGVGFAQKPKVEKQGDGWVITFAASAPIDATISVLGPDAKVVRHLAAGLLGANAPEPFRKNTLAQRIAWDGLDDLGRPAPAGCRVRVELGLRVEFARILCSAPQGLASRGPVGMAVDGEGNLYVEEGDLWIFGLGSAAVIQVLSVKAFDREGNYIRTLVPFRADRSAEKLSEIKFITTTDNRRVPLSLASNHRPYCGFTRGAPGTARNLPVITSDGRLIYPCGKQGFAGARRLIAIGIDGSASKEWYEGPLLQPGAYPFANLFLALSPDEKTIYYAGAYSKRNRRAERCNAVYRVGVDAKEPAKAFIGKEFQSGKGEGEFNDPRGVAVDARGRIYVGDYMNDRIQVFDAAGKFLKAMEIPGPEQVWVHPKTGAVYVLSVRDRGKKHTYGRGIAWDIYADKSVIKFRSLKEWEEVCRIDLPKRPSHMHDAGPIMVLDATHEEPVLWIANVGRQEPEDFLWKVVDRGAKLEKVPHNIPRLNRHAHRNPPLAADRRNNELYAFGVPEGHVRIDPATGAVRRLELAGEPGEAALKIVGAAAVGPEGMLYIRTGKVVNKKRERIWHIRRFDREGKVVPFKDAGEFIATNGKQAGTPFNEQPTPFAVGPDGRLYVVGAYSRQGRNCRMDLHGPEGKLLKPGYIATTRSGGCVRVDVQGRVYAADTVRPKERTFPDFYPADPRGHLYKWYGTVFRFDPTGGGLAPAEAAGATHMAGGRGVPLSPVTVEGAMWGFYGLSPMPLRTGCQCLMADFDADDWGRVWVPDAPGYCVAVLDSAGNLLTRFGAYGNQDATGAGSAVPEPAIPLWSPERVAVLDGDAFVADGLNTRLVQVRIRSRASAETRVP